MRKITEFNELFSLFIFLCWEEQAGKAISTGGIVSSLAGLWKTDSWCERIIMVLPAFRRWKALGYPKREGWYFCATLWWLVISFEDGLEKKEHTMATACSGRSGRGRGVITRCNFVAVKCILKSMKCVYLQKQNYSYDFWYILKPFCAQRYHFIYTQIYSTCSCLPLVTTEEICTEVSSHFGLLSGVMHTFGLLDKAAIPHFAICCSS